MIFFLYESFIPNTAHINRALAYFRSIESMRMPINVIFFLPDSAKHKIEESYRFIDIQYCWEHLYINHRVFKYLSYWYYVRRVLKRLHKGDKVYLYGLNDIRGRFVKQRGVEVFFEQTECPEVTLPGSWLHRPSLSEHIMHCKQIKGLIVISHSLKSYYENKGVDPSRIHVVNMIVDESRFVGVSKNENVERYIAYCGTVTNNKDGVDILIKAFGMVSKNHPDVKLYIIGKMPSKKDRNNNLELIDELGISDKVLLTGEVNASDMPQILTNAEVLALARPNNMQAQYGFPTKLGEYLLTGNPVVVTRVGDLALFLNDGLNALIAPPCNPKGFAVKLNWALEHPAECREIGKLGKNVAHLSFNAQNETIKLMSIIQGKTYK